MKLHRPWHSQWELKGANLCRVKLKADGRKNSCSWKTEKMLGEKTAQGKQWKLYGVRSSGNWKGMDHPRRRERVRKWANRPGCCVWEGISRITFQSMSLGWYLTGKGHKVTKDHCWHSRSFEDSEGWCHVGGNPSCLEPEFWIEWADVRAGPQ